MATPVCVTGCKASFVKPCVSIFKRLFGSTTMWSTRKCPLTYKKYVRFCLTFKWEIKFDVAKVLLFPGPFLCWWLKGHKSVSSFRKVWGFLVLMSRLWFVAYKKKRGVWQTYYENRKGKQTKQKNLNTKTHIFLLLLFILSKHDCYCPWSFTLVLQ